MGYRDVRWMFLPSAITKLLYHLFVHTGEKNVLFGHDILRIVEQTKGNGSRKSAQEKR